MMKKALIILGIIFLLIIAAVAIIPVVFKDEIKTEIDQQLANSVNADVFFEDFGVTMFRNFPGLTVYMSDFGISGRGEFEGLPLAAMESFELEINLLSLVFGDQIKINGIQLGSPVIYIKVLENGKANYDIAISDEDTVVTKEESSAAFSIGIDHWEITNGQIIYDDDPGRIFTKLMGVNHEGSGDFTQDVFDLRTITSIDTATVLFEDTKYMSDKRLEVNMILTISDDYGKYSFKENTIKINDFAFGFDGFLALIGDELDLDIRYATQDNSFKSLLSIIPGSMFTDYEEI